MKNVCASDFRKQKGKEEIINTHSSAENISMGAEAHCGKMVSPMDTPKWTRHEKGQALI